MQVQIRFNDVTKPINLNCKCGVIIEYIRNAAGIDSSVLLDLTDKDGNVKLMRQNLMQYATTILTPNETYFLVSATEENKMLVYKLLANLGPDEPPIDVKSTKVDKKQDTKRAAPKPQSKSRKGK